MQKTKDKFIKRLEKLYAKIRWLRLCNRGRGPHMQMR